MHSINKNSLKKNYHSSIKKIFLGGYNINMPNTQQDNKIEHINNKINLLQDLLKKNEKSLNQFQNGLIQIGRIRVQKGQKTNLSQTKKKIQNIVKNIFQNKIKQIKKNANILQNTLAHVKKKERQRTEGNSKNAESFTK